MAVIRCCLLLSVSLAVFSANFKPLKKTLRFCHIDHNSGLQPESSQQRYALNQVIWLIVLDLVEATTNKAKYVILVHKYSDNLHILKFAHLCRKQFHTFSLLYRKSAQRWTNCLDSKYGTLTWKLAEDVRAKLLKEMLIF